MAQSPSWEANMSSASQEIPRILWYPKVCCRIYNRPPSAPVLSQINKSMSPNPTSWRYSLILSRHLRFGLPSVLFPSVFPTKPLLFPIRVTYPVHLILLDLISRKVFGEEPRSWSSSLHSLLHSPVTSSFLGPNVFLSYRKPRFSTCSRTAVLGRIGMQCRNRIRMITDIYRVITSMYRACYLLLLWSWFLSIIVAARYSNFRTLLHMAVLWLICFTQFGFVLRSRSFCFEACIVAAKQDIFHVVFCGCMLPPPQN